MNKNIALTGIVLGSIPVEIPTELRNFLTNDGMDGIKDLDFMLRDPKLSRRIPKDVRYQYETIYAAISIDLDNNLDDLEQAIKEIRSNPKEVIHDFIQQSLEKNNAK